MAAADRSDEADQATVTIKKYANRRLYNTATSSYVTLDNLCDMVRNGEDFVVRDARSGDDITRQVLTQIIVEQEAKGQNMLPLSFLRQLIQLYGDNVQAFVPGYLEVAMETFARNQGDMRERMNSTFGGMFPVDEFEAMAERNMAMMQRTMEMFAGFPAGERREEPKADGDGQEEAPDVGAVLDRLDRMQAQLDALSGRGRKAADDD
ncbi:MAG: polyhydroxyalkanoate synthesis repressor PhaR [Rhodospirillales bacterium]|nr:polyhydroxyalkanoate synthesis repressor PhaR [Rhodospirillales bacterium]MDE0379078.1 polyhydroxyalkanoate synthesis repressor PhaR [Rhodospirillales bacterium]